MPFMHLLCQYCLCHKSDFAWMDWSDDISLKHLVDFIIYEGLLIWFIGSRGNFRSEGSAVWNIELVDCVRYYIDFFY